MANHVHFVWPLNGTTVPDEMNTSFGPRIDADRWDFHDGIDLPARLGTPVRAMASGVVHRAGPANKTAEGRGFGSTHIVLEVVDPTDAATNLYLVYLHLDGIADAVIPGAHVSQGDVIGAVGQEDATYPHLHFEFRKGGPEARRSVHPLRYLPSPNTATSRTFASIDAIFTAMTRRGRCGSVLRCRIAAKGIYRRFR